MVFLPKNCILKKCSSPSFVKFGLTTAENTGTQGYLQRNKITDARTSPRIGHFFYFFLRINFTVSAAAKAITDTATAVILTPK